MGDDQAGHRRAARRRLGAAGQDGAGAERRLEPDAIEEVWHAVEPPYATLFAWLDGRGPRPDPAQRAAFRPVMLAQALGEAELDAPRPRGLPRRMEVGRHPRPDRRRGRPAAPLFAHRRRDRRRLPRPDRGPGDRRNPRWRVAGRARRRGRALRRPAEAAQPQDRQSRRCGGATRPSSASTTCWWTAARTSAAAAFDARRARLEAWIAATRPHPHGPLRHGAVRHLGRTGRTARRATRHPVSRA